MLRTAAYLLSRTVRADRRTCADSDTLRVERAEEVSWLAPREMRLPGEGIEPKNSSTGCIPDSGLPRFADGYNAIAATLLKEKFGANYMTLLKEEMVRRMEELPKPAG
jgi:hypothetical protein